MAKQPGKKKRPVGWLKNPKEAREGEVIGGGWWVFRRGDGTNRIRPAMWPFEYDTREAALAQAHVLAKGNPGDKFIVVAQTDFVTVRLSSTAAA